MVPIQLDAVYSSILLNALQIEKNIEKLDLDQVSAQKTPTAAFMPIQRNDDELSSNSKVEKFVSCQSHGVSQYNACFSALKNRINCSHRIDPGQLFIEQSQAHRRKK